jgi:hypothetical protein
MSMVFLCSVFQFLVTANVIPSSLILVTLMMEAICSSETLALTRAMWQNIPEYGWHNIPEYGILHDIIVCPLDVEEIS